MQKHLIAPSILSADFARLGAEVDAVLQAGADVIHFDVMDSHYVPNLSFGPLVCRALREYGVTAPIDVHLMAKPVDRLIVDFAEAGASYISFHPEASEHVDRSLQLVREKGCKAGLVFNPATPLDCLEYLLERLDLVLLMSVNPGFGGQKFIPSTLRKLQTARRLIDSTRGGIKNEEDLNHRSPLEGEQAKQGLRPQLSGGGTIVQTFHENIRLAVDGGVGVDNIRAIADAGADMFIAGSAIFGAKNYTAVIDKMRAELDRKP